MHQRAADSGFTGFEALLSPRSHFHSSLFSFVVNHAKLGVCLYPRLLKLAAKCVVKSPCGTVEPLSLLPGITPQDPVSVA